MKKHILFILLIAIAIGANAKKAHSGDTIRVLAIGNSFSQDAIEQNLWELADATGIKLIIGNLYKGGCSLERHCNNYKNNIPDYQYRKIGCDGIKTNTKEYTIDNALADEKWDYVSLQQVSGMSGIYDSYYPFIVDLKAYVQAHVDKKCKFLFHQTWAYQQDAKHQDFSKYNSNQVSMYNAIMKTAKKVTKENKIKLVIPSGTAVQNARSTFIGDNMTRDGYHLNLVYGRYTAACTWFEIITGRSVINNPYAPEGMDSNYVQTTQTAAHKAVKKRWKVSK